MPNRYIDLTTDFGFKRLFGREESKAILKEFLVAILDLPHPIEELSFIPNEQLPASPGERVGIYDVYCRDTQGSRFIVEMQRNTFAYFKERTLYYATFPIIHQIEKGTIYNFQLMPVYCVSILRYQMDNEPNYLHHVQLVDTQTGKVFYTGLTFVYVELPKFTLTLDQLTTTQEKWVYLFKHIYDMDHIPDEFDEPPFQETFHIAELAALSEDERYIYQENVKRISDELGILETKRQEGKIEGRIEGKIEGKIEGLLSGITLGLDLKFGGCDAAMLAALQQIKNVDHLQVLHDTLRTAQSIHEIEQLVQQYTQ